MSGKIDSPSNCCSCDQNLEKIKIKYGKYFSKSGKIEKKVGNPEGNDTFLHRKRISPRKLFLAQGKVFPRAVFNPPRVGFAASSEARAVIETQGG